MAFNLADILSGLNPNIDADVLKAVRWFTRGNRDIVKALGKPSAVEKSAAKRLKEIKSEDVLKQDISNLFADTRAKAAEAMAAAPAMQSGFLGALSGAASGLGDLAGGDSRVAQLIASGAESAAAPVTEAATGLRALGQAAVGSTSVQEAAAQAEALGRRTARMDEIQNIIDEAVQGRSTARLEARAGQSNDFLKMLVSLLGLKSSGGYGGSSSGAVGTGGGNLGITNLFGQRKFAGDITLPSGYYLQDTSGTAQDLPQRYGVTGSGTSTYRRPIIGPRGSNR